MFNMTPDACPSENSCCAERATLIIDQDSAAAEELATLFGSIGCGPISRASSAQEALDLFHANRHGIVVTDIEVGGEDGIELVKRLLAVRRCVVLIVTSQGDPSQIARASAAGVFGYLIKPVTRENLAAQIGIAMGRCREQDRLIKANLDLVQTLEARSSWSAPRES